MRKKIEHKALPPQFLVFIEEDATEKKQAEQARRRFQKKKKFKDQVYRIHGRICVKCLARANLTIDHIKPIRDYPELSFDPQNVQVLCRRCNSKKGRRLE